MEDPEATHEPVPAGTEVPLWERTQAAARRAHRQVDYLFLGEVPLVLHSMSAGERSNFVATYGQINAQDNRDQAQLLIGLCARTPAGEPAYSGDEIDWLIDNAPADELIELVLACSRVSGFTKDDEDAAGKGS